MHTFGQPSSIPKEVSSLEFNYRARTMVCTWTQAAEDGVVAIRSNECLVRALLIFLYY